MKNNEKSGKMMKADGRGRRLVGEYVVDKPRLVGGLWVALMRRYTKDGRCVEEVVVRAATKDALDQRVFEIAFE